VAENQLRLDGLAELRKALQALTPELVREAGEIVQAAAADAARQITAAYPMRTGNLRGGMHVEIRRDATTAAASVQNTARFQHGPWPAAAWIFEKGTGPRRWGPPRAKQTGKMPAGKVFVPIAIQRRRIMMAALIDLVERAGLHVTGTA
jgi:hypothetical protein